ncbi:hypothetical protein [Spongiactinospora rosea]|nr:hypothetical protein [Spongiactinospora rosea]
MSGGRAAVSAPGGVAQRSKHRDERSALLDGGGRERVRHFPATV